MNKTLNTLMTTLLLTGACNAFAASSVDLSVKGLITPSACMPALSNGGVVDLGKISAKDLNATYETRLPDQILQLSVTCDAPTRMAIENKDNREGSAFFEESTFYGLGFINGNEKLGGMYLQVRSAVADGVPARIIQSANGEDWNWGSNVVERNYLISVADTTVAAPLPITVFTTDLTVRPSIAPTNQLTLNNEVAIDGSLTFTVKYL